MLMINFDLTFTMSIVLSLIITLVETFEGMDDQFKELASMLNFRDKSKERKENFEARRKGTLTEEDKDMDDWNKEMKVSINNLVSGKTFLYFLPALNCLKSYIFSTTFFCKQ